MELGLKALNPYFIHSNKEMSSYFELGFKHFERSCEDLNIDVGKWTEIGEKIARQVEYGQSLNNEEARLASLIGIGDKYWIKGCSKWQRPLLRKISAPLEVGIRYRISKKLNYYIDAHQKPITYSWPSDIEPDSSKRLRRNSLPSAILHLEWFEYILDNLDIDHQIDFQKAVDETSNYFLKEDKMSAQTIEVQTSLSQNDIKWVDEMMERYNYRPFWLQDAKKDLEIFIQDINHN